MNIELVKKKLEGMHDWQEFYLHEVGEMLTCAMEHIAKLEAAQQPLAPDAAPLCHECGEPFDFCAMGHYDVAKARRG